MFIITKLIGLLPLKWPEWLRTVAAWVLLALAAALLLAALKMAYDASVIDDHEQEKIGAAIDAYNDAADERAADAIVQADDERKRNEAIDAAPTGGALSPAERALNCERLCKLGRSPPGC